MTQLVGFDRGTVKKEGPNKGKDFMILHVVSDNVSLNTTGMTTENIFVFAEEILAKINADWLNRKIDITYNISNGRAYLKDVQLIK